MSEDESNPSNEPNYDRDTQNLLAMIYETQKQQKMLEDGIKKLGLVANNVQGIIAQETRNAVTKATEESFRESSRFMVEKAQELQTLKDEIKENLNKFKWKAIATWISLIMVVFIILSLLIMKLVPSLDEINQRRAFMEQTEKYLAQFKVKDGKVLVRIMSKKPCYGLEGTNVDDWCEIDPKKK